MSISYSGKVWWGEAWRGESLVNWLISSIWRKKVWRINRSANRLLIVSTNLDGFSLTNRGQFAKHSPCQTFLLYGTYVNLVIVVEAPVSEWHCCFYNMLQLIHDFSTLQQCLDNTLRGVYHGQHNTHFPSTGLRLIILYLLRPCIFKDVILLHYENI